VEGVVILLLVLAAATAFGLWRARTDGRMQHVDHPDLGRPDDGSGAGVGAGSGSGAGSGARGGSGSGSVSGSGAGAGSATGAGSGRGAGTEDAPDVPEEALDADDVSEPLVVDGQRMAPVDHAIVPAGHRLTEEELGVALGQRATLVQFSSAFCQPCRATRVVLGEVAEMVPGVTHVEIDAESHLDLVRRFDVMRTPTVLVLDAAGRVRKRATGAPRKADVIAALGQLD
jgi:thiol-disulfide isomerase/thioredoxin